MAIKQKVKVFKCQGCLGIFPAAQAGICQKCRKVMCLGCVAREGRDRVCVYCLGRKPRPPEDAVARYVMRMIKQNAATVEKSPAKKI